MSKFLSGILFLISFSLTAANYSGDIIQFQQPDGSSVDLRLFGSEYYMRAEGLDSYTLIRDQENKWICYAKLSEDGSKLVSTGIAYKGKENDFSKLRNDLNLPLHLDISPAERRKIIEMNQLLLGSENENNPNRIGSQTQSANNFNGTPINPLSGNILGLCIIVDFPDEPGTLPMTEYFDFCNDLNYTNFGNNGSLRTYYHDISGGQLDYQNVVYGYFRAPQTFAYYDSQPYASGAKTILGLALNWIASTGFDFSTLSINPDNSIMAINLMYTGVPPTWSQGMWFHKGTYNGFSANGVHSNVYNCSPANSPLYISTVCHENGHMICKWPDTYKYDQSEDGIGRFDLMCATGNRNNPVIPNPLFLNNVGWNEMIDVTNFNGLNYDTANSMTCYRYSNVNDTNEFFLLEHRQQTGRSMSIPDEGLTIWHIDRNGNNQTLQQEVYLEHANNDLSNDYDACYNNPYATEFSQNTTPSSDWYSGNPSGLIVWGVDSPVVDVLPYHIGLGSAVSDLTLEYLQISDDDNFNGFIEPGETANLNITAGNIGQISSNNATLFCSATGPNAGYITINTPSVTMGNIELILPYLGLVNISADPLTPLGTVIDFQFTLTDNLDSATMTTQIVIGRQVIMNGISTNVCTAVFYDPGFLNNYNDSTDYVKTLTPAIAANKISADFISFDLENDPSCNNDFLKIYDGPNQSSPLIGTYCGTNSPGIVTSTDPTGKLTFVFHSNGSVTGTGWEALLSCSQITGINYLADAAIDIYPNPTSGKVIIKSDKIELLRLTDALGRDMKIFISPNGKNIVLDLTNEANGVYFLKCRTNEGVGCVKILKD